MALLLVANFEIFAAGNVRRHRGGLATSKRANGNWLGHTPLNIRYLSEVIKRMQDSIPNGNKKSYINASQMNHSIIFCREVSRT